MKWLVLDWDGHEYYQSQFAARHAEVAQELLARGQAYRCYMTQEELAEQRAKAQAERRPFKVNSVWRDCSTDRPTPEATFVMCLKAQSEGEKVIEATVTGRDHVQNSDIDELILLRSDG